MTCVLLSVGFVGTMAPSSKPMPAWDWTGILGTGQSLSVGGTATPIPLSEPSFGNLKLDSGDLSWPVDPNDPKLTLVPLTEPVGRRSVGYPSAWPQNIDGETYHSSMASEVSALARSAKHDVLTIHYEVAEAGQGMVRIRKEPVRDGVTGRSYEAAMISTKAIVRLAKAAGKSFGIGAVVMTHGETDTGNAAYEAELVKLAADYDADLKAITGQTRGVLMIVSQHNRLGDYSPSTIAQWKAGDDHPEAIVCSGPKYQYPYARDALHLRNEGYRLLGEKYGQVYFERVVRGHAWRPLEPERTTWRGNEVTIRFHVPKAPLVWDEGLGPPHPSSPEWSNGKGFEIADSVGKRIAIRSATIRGRDTVVLDLATDPGRRARLSYALVGEPTLRNPQFGASPHWGLLRDSDPFVGFTTHHPQPNYCVAFEATSP